MKTIICIFSICLLISCSSSPEIVYENSGVSFTSPAGWRISEEENIEGVGYYLSVEKDGWDSSGLFTLSWVDYEADPVESLLLYQEELNNLMLSGYANLEFQQIEDSYFNNYPTKSCRYTANILGIPHAGIIHSFYFNGKTISVVKQEAIEDKYKNREGFQILENSFKSI